MLRQITFRFYLYTFLGVLVWMILILAGSTLLIGTSHAWLFLSISFFLALVSLLPLLRSPFRNYAYFLKVHLPEIGEPLTTLLTASFNHPAEKLFQKRLKIDLERQLLSLPFSLAFMAPLYSFSWRGILFLLYALFFFTVQPKTLPSRASALSKKDVRLYAFPPAYIKGQRKIIKNRRTTLWEGSKIVIQRASSLPIQISGLTKPPFYLREEYNFQLFEDKTISFLSFRGKSRVYLQVLKDKSPVIAISHSGKNFLSGEPIFLSFFVSDDYGVDVVRVLVNGQIVREFKPHRASFVASYTFTGGKLPVEVKIVAQDNCPYREQTVEQKLRFSPVFQKRLSLHKGRKEHLDSSFYPSLKSSSSSKFLSVSDVSGFLRDMKSLLRKYSSVGLNSSKSSPFFKQLFPYLSEETKQKFMKAAEIAHQLPLQKNFQEQLLWKREEWQKKREEQAKITAEWQEILKQSHLLSLAEDLQHKEAQLLEHLKSMQQRQVSPFVQKGMLSYHLHEQKRAKQMLSQIKRVEPALKSVPKMQATLEQTKKSLERKELEPSFQKTAQLESEARALKKEIESRLGKAFAAKRRKWLKEWEKTAASLVSLLSAHQSLSEEVKKKIPLSKHESQEFGAEEATLKEQADRVVKQMQRWMLKTFQWNAQFQDQTNSFLSALSKAKSALQSGKGGTALRKQKAAYGQGNLLGLDFHGAKKQLEKAEAKAFSAQAQAFLEKLAQRQLEAMQRAQQGLPMPQSWDWFMANYQKQKLMEAFQKELEKKIQKWSKQGSQMTKVKRSGQKNFQSGRKEKRRKLHLLREYIKLYYALKAQGEEQKRESQPGKSFSPLHISPLKLSPVHKRALSSPLMTRYEKAIRQYFQKLPLFEK